MKQDIGSVVGGTVISMVLLGITGSVLVWVVTALGSGILSYAGKAIAERVHRFLDKKKQTRKKK